MGIMDAARALLNIGNSDDEYEDSTSSAHALANPTGGAHKPLTVAGDERDEGLCGNSSSTEVSTRHVVEECGDNLEEGEDGPDPWGEGVGENDWGENTGLALIEALGSWCASVSAYDRLAHPIPGSAAQRAVEAESEWEDLERRIARGRLDVELEEFR